MAKDFKIYKWETDSDTPHCDPTFWISQDKSLWLITVNDIIPSEHMVEVSKVRRPNKGLKKLKADGEIRDSSWLELLVVFSLDKEVVEGLIAKLDSKSKIALVSRSTGKITIYTNINDGSFVVGAEIL